MSATNLTKNLKLSQFVASDKPSWLGDVNGDNKKIDDGYGVLAGEISKANDTASSAKSQSDANTQTLTNVNSELEDYGNRITALEAGGGTEQLEQRVNTLSTDVEALQTRADTFEADITQNGTDITTLKGKVDTIEPKVKTNTDNIKSLQTTTNGMSEEITSLRTMTSSADSKATNAKSVADGAYTLAQNANNTSQTNTGRIDSLSSSMNNYSKDKITFIRGTIKNGSSAFVQVLTQFIHDTTTNTGIIIVPLLSPTGFNVSSTGIIVSQYDLQGSIIQYSGKTIYFNSESITLNGSTFIINGSLTESTLTITISSPNGKSWPGGGGYYVPCTYSLI